MTTSDPHLHHRRSIRLKGYDYTLPGAYFVTLVTYHRDEIFGSIKNGAMHFSPLGQIVHDEWMRSADIRREICLYEDEFVIMPNHVHGIVWITTPVGADGVRPNTVVRPNIGLHPTNILRPNTVVRPNTIVPPINGIYPTPPKIAIHPGLGAILAPLPSLPHRPPRSLSSFIAGYKSSVTSRAKCELDLTTNWQRNYYDHIIRSEQDFLKIWEYIDTNPQKWQDDQLHPSASLKFD
jgi:REP element-mobilizing transposase RayT